MNLSSRKIISAIMVLVLSFASALPVKAGDRRITLAGEWKLSLDSASTIHTINLPGSTDEAGIGKAHVDGTNLHTGKSEIWGLARKRVFIGAAWYEREVDIPQSWMDKHVEISLERCMWTTKLWINGVCAGDENSLCVPHKYDVTGLVKPGKNIIRICIDSSPYVNLGTWSHGYAPGIQTIWNGVIGELYLEAKDKIYIDNIQCYPSLKDKALQVKAALTNIAEEDRNGTVKLSLIDANGRTILRNNQRVQSKKGSSDFIAELKIDKPVMAWDEYEPNLYTLAVDYKFGPYEGKETVKFGFRDFSKADGQLILNGRTIFLRGEHDAGSFPLTGYPSMEKDDWVKIFNVGKQYGLNHWRFHSWCPPRAAFEAADEVGIYLQPELTLFSQNWENTLVGQDAKRDEFLFAELQRLLDTYGNHPSFLLMCMGNELKGSEAVLEQWVDFGKKHDKRHLYASNANLEAMRKFLPLKGDEYQVAHAAKVDGRRYERRMGGYYNSERPNTTNDYSHTMKSPYDQWPVITHELGQWEVYPDFSEMDKYTGVVTPRNMGIFKSLLEQKGMADMAPKFLDASGRLSAILYKEEMERVLRTPGLDGFQILDLHDYPAQGSALVGLLNVFWESKGVITPEEFRQSCSDVTLLLKMPKRTWTNSEDFNAEVVIPNYSKGDLKDMAIYWDIVSDGKVLISDSIHSGALPQGQVSPCGKIFFPLNIFREASKVTLRMKTLAIDASNEYDFWVYPASHKDATGNVVIAEKATPELLKQIEEGASVLLVPKSVKDAERMTFATPFWSTIMFDYQPKTMGLLCDSKHPIFKHFPTDTHTNWQWWSLTRNAFAARLNSTDANYRPLVQVIDHPVRNDKLGAIMETRIGNGKLLVCMFDILSGLDKRHEARSLRNSILHYMNSVDFAPQEVQGLKEVFFTGLKPESPYKSITLAGENPEYPVSNLIDSKAHTHCALPIDSSKVVVNIDFRAERYITGIKMLKPAEGIDGFKVFITNDKKDKGDAIIFGDGKATEYQAISWDNGFTVQKGKKGKHIIIEIDKKEEQSSILYDLDFIFGD